MLGREAEMTPDEELALHRPILERLKRLIRRRPTARRLRPTLPADWLFTAFLALTHAAGDEVAAGRLAATRRSSCCGAAFPCPSVSADTDGR